MQTTVVVQALEEIDVDALVVVSFDKDSAGGGLGDGAAFVVLLGRGGSSVPADARSLARINGTRAEVAAIRRRLEECSAICSTWVQTCLFELE